MEFEKIIKKAIRHNYHNNYGIENYDHIRFGDYKEFYKRYHIEENTYKQKIKNRIKRIIRYKTKKAAEELYNSISNYHEGLGWLYSKLNITDKKLLVELIAYRLLGYKKIKLMRNNKTYWNQLRKADKLVEGKDVYDPKFLHFKLSKMDLSKIGYPIKLYFSPMGVLIDFLIEQYAYKKENGINVQAESGDIVFDLGGCWGDTALYFAEKVGKTGHVFSFEFIPGNVELHRLNQSFNPGHEKLITLVENPISEISGINIYYKDFGPGSKISFYEFDGQNGVTKTLSIDDFVKINSINKIDFIKMDIEGAELLALKGAINTIRKFKPKLAIAVYHSLDDIVSIPKWIDDLGLGYKLYLDHFTIHEEETVLFAKA
jgi:FkbM family methyltransferase